MSRRKPTLFSPIAVSDDVVYWGAGKFLFGMNMTTGSWVFNRLERPDTIRGISVFDGHVLVGDDSKAVALYKIADGSFVREWVSQEKKITCVSLVPSKSGNKILFGDRYGDVRSILVNAEGDDREIEGESSGSLALGHLCSSITCLDTDASQNVLVTADGDEKIRVSSLTNTALTKAFCLGHKEFISAVKVLPGGVLLSSSADGAVKVWNFKTGDELCSLQTNFGALTQLSVFSVSADEAYAVAVADDTDAYTVVRVNVTRNGAAPASATLNIAGTASGLPYKVLNAALVSSTTGFKGQALKTSLPVAVVVVDTEGRLRLPRDAFSGEEIAVEGFEGMATGEPIAPVDINFWRWRGPTADEVDDEVDQNGRKKRRRAQPPPELLAEVEQQ